MTSPIEVPFDLDGNLILVQVENRGSDSLKFVLDTGAEFSIIDKKLAEDRGLDVGHIPTCRMGIIDVRNVQSLNIPGVNPECPWMEVSSYDLAPVHGLIGGDILGRYCVEIDYQQRAVRFFDPQGYQPPVGVGRIGVSIKQGCADIYVGDEFSKCKIFTYRPFVQAALMVSGSQSCTGKFLIDTGNPPAFVLSEAFTKKHGILKGVREIRNFCPLAASGDGEYLVRRLEAVSIGDIGLKIALPLVNCYQEPMWDENRYDGIIGGEVLSRFRISLDYDSKQMILEPNEYFDQPYEFDMSGTYLKRHKEGFELWKLIGPSDSPAVEAELKEGDIITAIDGKPHNNLTCDHVDQMFSQDRREYHLEVGRPGGVFKTRIKTRSLI